MCTRKLVKKNGGVVDGIGIRLPGTILAVYNYVNDARDSYYTRTIACLSYIVVLLLLKSIVVVTIP